MLFTPQDIIDFWYSAAAEGKWFSSTPQFDAELKLVYEKTWQDAKEGKLDSWCDTPLGCLALIIVLDQFPLNMFRGQAKSFQTEDKAIRIAKYAIEKGFDQLLDKDKLAFLYMPLMHSENLADQDLAVSCFEKSSLTHNAKFARHHRELIRRFGRFPHRNAILNRESSQEEVAYLNSAHAFKG